MGNDSVCSALIYKPGLDITNVIVKNSVDATIHAAQDLNQLFPLSTVFFTWLPGLQNCADPLTKMFPDGVGICNSDVWRFGHLIMQNEVTNLENTYMTVSEGTVKYLGLPEKFTNISHNATHLAKACAEDSFDSRESNVLKCSLCGFTEDSCGLLLKLERRLRRKTFRLLFLMFLLVIRLVLIRLLRFQRFQRKLNFLRMTQDTSLLFHQKPLQQKTKFFVNILFR
jgi:hypothetical protein